MGGGKKSSIQPGVQSLFVVQEIDEFALIFMLPAAAIIKVNYLFHLGITDLDLRNLVLKKCVHHASNFPKRSKSSPD